MNDDDFAHARLQTLMEIRANIILHTKPTAAQGVILDIIDALAELPEIEPIKRKAKA